jgi:hypothetical protein
MISDMNEDEDLAEDSITPGVLLCYVLFGIDNLLWLIEVIYIFLILYRVRTKTQQLYKIPLSSKGNYGVNNCICSLMCPNIAAMQL